MDILKVLKTNPLAPKVDLIATPSAVMKHNPYHDKRGRFTTADGAGKDIIGDMVASGAKASVVADARAALAQVRGGGGMSSYYQKYDDPDITLDKLMSNVSKDDQAEIADRIQQAQSGKTSKELFSKPDGSYTDSRKELHAKILDEIFTPEAIAAATPKDGESKSMVVLGGRGGSGKSSFLAHGDVDAKVNEFDSRKYLVLDSDAIKGKLRPPYEGWNAFTVHEESSELFDMATDIAQSMGLNILHDATLKSRGVEKTIKRLKDDGYDIEGHYMFLPRQTAAERALKRYLSKGPEKRGRLVPPAIVLSNTENEKNFDHLKQYFTNWSAYDNQGTAPKLIERKKRKGKK